MPTVFADSMKWIRDSLEMKFGGKDVASFGIRTGRTLRLVSTEEATFAHTSECIF
jgi:hypothetical protein